MTTAMPLLDTIRLTLELRRARSMADAQEFDEALQLLAEMEGEAVRTVRTSVRDDAVRYWVDAAERTAERGEAAKTRLRLQRARRYAGDGHPALDALERRLRRKALRETRAEHYAPLLDVTQSGPPDPGWQLLRSKKLGRAVEALWGVELTPDAVEHADRLALSAARDLVADRYPSGLLPKHGLDEAFVRGALNVAIGRPDCAVLPLLEADDREPLVAFELARVAQALGHVDVAVVALEGFAARAGGHHRIDRLHSGVFLAQMCLATGRTLQALELYEDLPVALLGGRPSLLFARLLLDHGRGDEAAALLRGVQERQPELDGLEPLLQEAGLPTSPGPR